MGAATTLPQCCTANGVPRRNDKDGEPRSRGYEDPLQVGEDPILFARAAAVAGSSAAAEEAALEALEASCPTTTSEHSTTNKWEEYHIVVDRTRGTKLGIDVDYVADRQMLPIRSVTAEGLIPEWNTANPNCRVAERDCIIEINGDRLVADLLMDWCVRQEVLHMTLRRHH